MQLNPEQKNKLKKVARLADFEERGGHALLEYLYAVDDQVNIEIPELKSLIKSLEDKIVSEETINAHLQELFEGLEIPAPQHVTIREEINHEKIINEIKSYIDSKTVAKVEKPNTITKIIREVVEKKADNETVAAEVYEKITKDLVKMEFVTEEMLEVSNIKGLEDYGKLLNLLKENSGWRGVKVGGSRYFSKLNDVNVKGITNGQAPIYNSTTEQYEPGNVAIESYETFSKNLMGYPYEIEEVSSTVTTITYNGDIIKTITEVSATVTTIVFSGNYSLPITTKTITETSPTLTTITYS